MYACWKCDSSNWYSEKKTFFNIVMQQLKFLKTIENEIKSNQNISFREEFKMFAFWSQTLRCFYQNSCNFLYIWLGKLPFSVGIHIEYFRMDMGIFVILAVCISSNEKIWFSNQSIYSVFQCFPEYRQSFFLYFRAFRGTVTACLKCKGKWRQNIRLMYWWSQDMWFVRYIIHQRARLDQWLFVTHFIVAGNETQ